MAETVISLDEWRQQARNPAPSQGGGALKEDSMSDNKTYSGEELEKAKGSAYSHGLWVGMVAGIERTINVLYAFAVHVVFVALLYEPNLDAWPAEVAANWVVAAVLAVIGVAVMYVWSHTHDWKNHIADIIPSALPILVLLFAAGGPDVADIPQQYQGRIDEYLAWWRASWAAHFLLNLAMLIALVSVPLVRKWLARRRRRSSGTT